MSTCSAARRSRKTGFTLFEVLAGVLVLGLLYTALAGAAMRGLRSEGTDRRRAVAALLADQELKAIELDLKTGIAVPDGVVEKEAEPYTVVVEVQPLDVLALLPGPVREEVARTTDPNAPSVLLDERGRSRVRLVSILVEWDEAGETDHVERTTYAFDTSALAALFPPENAQGSEEGGEQTGSLEELRQQAPPELQQLINQAEQGSR